MMRVARWRTPPPRVRPRNRHRARNPPASWPDGVGCFAALTFTSRCAMERRLAAILAADVVGYSRLMAEDEEGTLSTFVTYRTALTNLVAEHGGRIFRAAGDSMMAEFPSPDRKSTRLNSSHLG